MDLNTLKFVKNVLPKGRTLYYDFPDRYALILLKHIVGEEGCRVADIKKSSIAPLLNKECVKQILASSGDGLIFRDDIKKAWPADLFAFRLTLGSWPDLDEKPDPSWHQITRKGWNLVLQLNFAISHNRHLKKHVPDWNEFLEYSPHPIAKGKEITLAWARIDLDIDTGEALIEEIQSDWIRDAKYLANQRKGEHTEAWKKYYDDILLPHYKKWSETMLSATLWFLLEELGIYTIFYHTFDSGARLKNIEENPPPKSLYTSLPKKYCFRLTHNGPLFIRDSADRKMRENFTSPETQWYILDF